MSNYPKFNVGVDEDGHEVMLRPGEINDLIPVYFDPLVLRRFYEQPSKYGVFFPSHGMGGVSRTDEREWHLRVGRNDSGFIIMLLNSLNKESLPAKDVSHWHSYNISPKGGMPDDYYNTMFRCQPSREPSLEMRLIDSRYWITKAIEDKGMVIYKPYAGPEVDIESSLRIPLINEPDDIAHKEFSDAIQVLSKMFVEYLSSRKIMFEALPPEVKDEDDGPIVVFSKWLQHVVGMPEETALSLRSALKKLQMVRSKTGIAHKFSDDSYQKVINKLGLAGQEVTAQKLFSATAEPLANSLESLCVALDATEELYWLDE